MKKLKKVLLAAPELYVIGLLNLFMVIFTISLHNYRFMPLHLLMFLGSFGSAVYFSVVEYMKLTWHTVLIADGTEDGNKERMDIKGVILPDGVVDVIHNNHIVGYAELKKSGDAVKARFIILDKDLFKYTPCVAGTTFEATVLSDGTRLVRTCRVDSILLSLYNSDYRIKPLHRTLT